jgi:hypothetical protein
MQYEDPPTTHHLTPAMFNTGQRVVCVDDKFDPWVYDLYTALPSKNVTYTVRDLCPGKCNPAFGLTESAELVMAASDPEILIRLVELVNPTDPSTSPPQELGFRAERFAPLQEDLEEVAEVVSVGVDGEESRGWAGIHHN